MKPFVKNFVIILIAVLMIGTVFVISRYGNRAPHTNTDEELTVSNQINERSEIDNADFDQDGLPDWKEFLLGTDPKNPDTDEDGTLDGEEVDLGRDPLIQAPDDYPNTEIKTGNKEKELNATEKLSRELFAEYLRLKQSGLSSQEAMNETMNTLVQSGQVSITAPQYNPTNIQISNDSLENIKRYGNEFGYILISNSAQNTKNEIEILTEAMKEDQEELLKPLKEISQNYQNIVDDLLTITVPQSASGLHTNIVNTLSYMSVIINIMSDIFQDPVSGISAIERYEPTILLMQKQFIDLKSYFENRGVQFTPKESGYVVTHMF